jgi:hypothetical protein
LHAISVLGCDQTIPKNELLFIIRWGGKTGSGVMSGTKIFESKTIKNPSVWAER